MSTINFTKLARTARLAVPLIAGLCLAAPAMANAAVYQLNYDHTLFTVTTIGTNEFTFDIQNIPGGWPTATFLNSFAFSTASIGTSTGLTATETLPGSTGATTKTGGLNASGCDGSGGFTCFSFATSLIPVAPELTFDIKTTSTFNFASTGPDLKIDFVAFNDKKGAFEKVGSLVSDSIPLCTSDVCNGRTGGGGGGIPEPATWAMMLVGLGAIGGVLRSRRTTAATA